MYDIKKLKQLREDTGISFSLCKKSLVESKNDLVVARKLLSKWGVEKVKDKSNRITASGALFTYVHHNKKIASLIELLCETDFVANNSDFQKLGTELVMQAAAIPAESPKDFLTQTYARDPSMKIEDLLKGAVLKFGENIKIGKIFRFELGN